MKSSVTRTGGQRGFDMTSSTLNKDAKTSFSSLRTVYIRYSLRWIIFRLWMATSTLSHPSGQAVWAPGTVRVYRYVTVWTGGVGRGFPGLSDTDDSQEELRVWRETLWESTVNRNYPCWFCAQRKATRAGVQYSIFKNSDVRGRERRNIQYASSLVTLGKLAYSVETKTIVSQRIHHRQDGYVCVWST